MSESPPFFFDCRRARQFKLVSAHQVRNAFPLSPPFSRRNAFPFGTALRDSLNSSPRAKHAMSSLSAPVQPTQCVSFHPGDNTAEGWIEALLIQNGGDEASVVFQGGEMARVKTTQIRRDPLKAPANVSV